MLREPLGDPQLRLQFLSDGINDPMPSLGLSRLAPGVM